MCGVDWRYGIRTIVLRRNEWCRGRELLPTASYATACNSISRDFQESGVSVAGIRPLGYEPERST